MRVVFIAVAFALAPLTVASCATTPSSAGARQNAFYDDLAPHGDWWWRPGVGWVFSPDVGAGWAPYTMGRWGWSGMDGWTWFSSEPFGWATYHYGNWASFDGRWGWIPGDVWAPAWVEWRHGPGVIGWSPVGVNRWVFVRETHLLEPRVASRVLPRHLADGALASSRVVHRPVRDVDGRMVNPGISPRTIEGASGRPVTPMDDDAALATQRERYNPLGGHLRERDWSRHEDAFGGELERERAKARAVEEHRRRSALERGR